MCRLEFYETKPHASLWTSDVCRGNMLQLAPGSTCTELAGNPSWKESLCFSKKRCFMCASLSKLLLALHNFNVNCKFVMTYSWKVDRITKPCWQQANFHLLSEQWCQKSVLHRYTILGGLRHHKVLFVSHNVFFCISSLSIASILKLPLQGCPNYHFAFLRKNSFKSEVVH